MDDEVSNNNDLEGEDGSVIVSTPVVVGRVYSRLSYDRSQVLGTVFVVTTDRVPSGPISDLRGRASWYIPRGPQARLGALKATRAASTGCPIFTLTPGSSPGA